MIRDVVFFWFEVHDGSAAVHAKFISAVLDVIERSHLADMSRKSGIIFAELFCVRFQGHDIKSLGRCNEDLYKEQARGEDGNSAECE